MNSRSDGYAMLRIKVLDSIGRALDSCLDSEPWFVSSLSTCNIMPDDIGPLAVKRAIEEAQDD